MIIDNRRLYTFLSACGGNWRNCIYIPCSNSHPGYLLTTDRDGRPLVMSVEQLQQLSGEQLDPAECCGQLTEGAFRSLYARYLLWHLPADDVNALAALNSLH